MKKSLLSILILGMFWACQNPYSGLGNALDLEAPRVSITSHKNMDYVGSQFVLSGQASDNLGVTAVRGEIQGTDLVFEGKPEEGGRWSLQVSGSRDGQSALKDGEYMVRVMAQDAAGNTGETSVASLTLVVDTTSPAALVSSPPLKPLNYLKALWPDGNRDFPTVDFFQNGKFQIRGASEENFRLDTVVIDLIYQDQVIESRTLTSGQPVPGDFTGTIWNWTWNLDAQLLQFQGQPLTPGQIHYMKLRVTIRDMNPDNPATVLEPKDETSPGYLAVFPDADRPWSGVSTHGEGESLQPGVLISGNAWDDDGLGAIYLKIQKASDPLPGPEAYLGWSTSLGPSWASRVIKEFADSPRVYTWSLNSPKDPGDYRLFIRTADRNGLMDLTYRTLDFTVVDQSFPMTEITSPENLAVVPPTGRGTFTLTGFSYDNLRVTSLKMAWLPQGEAGKSVLSGENWAEAATSQVFTDPATGIRIWDLTGDLKDAGFDVRLPYEGAGGRFKWTWTRDFHVDSDFLRKGEPEYSSRNLVFQTKDSNGNVTYTRLTLGGETASPKVKVTFPGKNGETYPSTPADPLVLRGEVSDNSGIRSVQVRWVEGNITGEAAVLEDGTWSLSTAVFMGGDTPFQGDCNFEIKAVDLYGNVGFSQTFVMVDNQPPQVTGVSSLTPNGYYNQTQSVKIQVTFSKNVAVQGDPAALPTLKLDMGGGRIGQAVYSGGSGSNTLEFVYQITSGDTSADLEYLDRDSLVTHESTITDAKSAVPAGLTLPAPGTSGSLSFNKDIRIDTLAPAVTSLSFDALPAERFFRAGAQIALKVNFSEVVQVEGSTPSLRVNTQAAETRTAVYAAGSGTSSLLFYYNVLSGDNSSALDAYSSAALSGTLRDLAGNAAPLVLPVPGEAGSLSQSAQVVVDTVPPVRPTLLAGGAALTTGLRNAGFSLELGELEPGLLHEYSLDGGAQWLPYGGAVSVTLDRQYLLTARQKDKAGNLSPQADTVNLTLDTTPPEAPLVAGLFAGTFADTQSFRLSGEPQAGTQLQYTLNYQSAADAAAPWTREGSSWQTYSGGEVSLSDPGTYRIRARQRDAAGNVGAPGLEIVVTIDRDPPFVTGISTTTPPGHYNAGKQISITVTFNKKVYAIDGPKIWLLDLNGDGTADAGDRFAHYAVGAGTPSLTFVYSVQPGDNQSLLDYVSHQALELGSVGSSIKDAVGNAGILTLPVPKNSGDGTASLSDLVTLVVDTGAPASPVFTLQPAEGAFTKEAVGITVAGEPGASLFYSLNGGASWNPTAPAQTSGSFTVSATGTYNVKVKQRDAAGNESLESVSHTFTIDSTPPDRPVIIGLVEGAGSTFAADQKFRPFGENGAAFEFNLGYTAGDEASPWGSGGKWISYEGAAKDAGGNIVLTTAANTATTFKVAARQRDAAGNVGPVSTVYQVTINKTPARITGVAGPSSPKAGYRAGDIINLEVTFDKAVYVVSGAPELLLETGATDRAATYSFGSGTTKLTFSYVVQAGDSTLDLDYVAAGGGYATPGNFGLWTASIQDAVGNHSNLSLPSPGASGSLGASSALVVDTAVPTPPVLNLSTGTYATNQTLTVTGESGATLEYSLNGGAQWKTGAGETLSTDGTYLILARQTDAAGNRSGDSATVTVTVDKTPPTAPVILGLVNGTFSADQSFTMAGEGNAALQYTLAYTAADESAAWNSGSWQNYTGTVSLSSPGTYGIRGRQKDLAGNISPSGLSFTVTIDKSSPAVTGVTSSSPDGAYNLNKIISLQVTFSKPVYVSGAPRILLETGPTVRYGSYTTGSGTSTLNFAYEVLAGDVSGDLDYKSTTALELNGGAIQDVLGNGAVLTLPGVGTLASLAGAKDLKVDTSTPAAPAIGGITPGQKKENQSFTLTGEPGAVLQFSTDGGTSWGTYSSPVTLTTEKAYIVTARQSDAAGNVSDPAAAIGLTIDKTAPAAPFISGITSGDKGTNQTFEVFGETGAALEYSLNNGTSWAAYTGSVALNPGVGNESTYQVKARQTDAAGNLGNATGTISLKVDLRAPGITTYLPAQGAQNVLAAGSIKLTFSEPVWRESGNITIKRVTNSLPLVMTVDQYNEYLNALTVAGNSTHIASYKDAYQLRTNGVLAGGAPDPTAKYVLKFDRGYNDATLLPIFESLGYNTRSIPVDSTQVTGTGTNTITITPSGGLPIGIEYYVTVAGTAFRDSVGNTFAGISSSTDYRFTTGPVATPVIRVNRISSNGYTSTTALTTHFRVDVDTAGASIVYSMPSTSTATDSAADFPGPVATVPGTAYSAPVTLGLDNPGVNEQVTYNKGWKYHIQAKATKSGLDDSSLAGERAFRTVLSATKPWFRGSNNSGGPTTAPGFPLRWEDNAVGYIRRGIQNSGTGNFFFISWEIQDYVHFKALDGGNMSTESNPAGYPAGSYEAGPTSYGWGAGANYNVYPGGYRVAAHSSYEALANRRGDISTWIYRPLGE